MNNIIQLQGTSNVDGWNIEAVEMMTEYLDRTAALSQGGGLARQHDKERTSETLPGRIGWLYSDVPLSITIDGVRYEPQTLLNYIPMSTILEKDFVH